MAQIIYKNKDGGRLPSVTTVLKNLGWSTDALMYWAWKEGCEGRNYRDTSQGAATSGTIAHAMIEADVKGEPFDLKKLELDKESRRQVSLCFDAWKDWKDQTKLEVIASEVSLTSEKHQFGGTLDCAGIYKKRSILDIKTSTGIYPDHLLQISAYGYLWNEHKPSEPIEEYHIIRLGKNDGSFHHHKWGNLDVAWKTFKHALAIHKNAKKLKSMV